MIQLQLKLVTFLVVLLLSLTQDLQGSGGGQLIDIDKLLGIGSDPSLGGPAERKDKPKAQQVPRLITPEERDMLYGWIKYNNQQKVVAFFNDNRFIDYPLIRFKGTMLHGYTPLAAAIHFCAVETAKVLAVAQYYPGAEWTTDLAPGYSNAEIAAKHCPRLLVQVIEHETKRKTSTSTQEDVEGEVHSGASTESTGSKSPHVLAPMLNNLDSVQLANIVIDTTLRLETEKEIIHRWVSTHFSEKMELSEAAKRDETHADRDTNKQQEASNSILKFDLFFDAWIRKGAHELDLTHFIMKYIKPDSIGLFNNALLRMFKAGMFEAVMRIMYEILKKPTQENIEFAESLVAMAAPHFLPEQVLKFKRVEQEFLKKSFNSINLQKSSENFMKVINYATDSIIDLARSLSADASQDQQYKAMFSMIFGPSSAQKFIIKQLPRFYNFFIAKYPRVDTAVALTGRDKDLKVYWTGKDENIDGGNFKNLIYAFNEDKDTESLESFMIFEGRLKQKYSQYDLKDIRLFFAPYHLSLLKSAVMLKKANIVEYLINKEDKPHSLYASTRFQLNALEMAACYHPEFLVDHILPLIGTKCSDRLRAANTVIEMFQESTFIKCPTRAQNAEKVLPKLLEFENEDGTEIECIDFVTKDAVEEALKLKFPIELIKAFYSTKKYTKTGYYITMAAKRGNLELFKYFVEQNKTENSDATLQTETKIEELPQALAVWTRYTDGSMTEENIAMMEYLLKTEEIDVNTYDSSGTTALSIATQRSLVWIMKRLLLVPNLDVNLVDLGTSTPPIQHAINIFRNDFKGPDLNNEPILVRLIVMAASEMDLPAQGAALDAIRGGAKKILEFKMGDDKKREFYEGMNRIPNQYAKVLIYKIVGRFIERFYGSPTSEWIFIFLDFLVHIESLLKNEVLMQLLKTHPDYSEEHFLMIKPGIELVKSGISEILIMTEKMGNDDAIRSLGKASPHYGLPHNLLLAHPDLDTTIENNAQLDALQMVKFRAINLEGDEDGAHEMFRSHVRVKNIYNVHDGKRDSKRIVLGVISTIIVGAASAGILRWMI